MSFERDQDEREDEEIRKRSPKRTRRLSSCGTDRGAGERLQAADRD